MVYLTQIKAVAYFSNIAVVYFSKIPQTAGSSEIEHTGTILYATKITPQESDLAII